MDKMLGLWLARVSATRVPGSDGTPRVLTAVPRETREEPFVAAVLVAILDSKTPCLLI